MLDELEAKVRKYEARATKCEEQAREASDTSQINFYDVLPATIAVSPPISATSSKSAAWLSA